MEPHGGYYAEASSSPGWGREEADDIHRHTRSCQRQERWFGPLPRSLATSLVSADRFSPSLLLPLLARRHETAVTTPLLAPMPPYLAPWSPRPCLQLPSEAVTASVRVCLSRVVPILQTRRLRLGLASLIQGHTAAGLPAGQGPSGPADLPGLRLHPPPHTPPQGCVSKSRVSWEYWARSSPPQSPWSRPPHGSIRVWGTMFPWAQDGHGHPGSRGMGEPKVGGVPRPRGCDFSAQSRPGVEALGH